ncbi:hypothetical protein L0Y65_03000 [Candidatus Micrarchaeota archaeon]|nr:hypothetical protein [Candidatus Micrarchaeota archaeon]
MSGVLERLLGIKGRSHAKSYFIGLERGRVWAEDCADYFELREWSELDVGEFDDLVLPHNETDHFRLMLSETPIEWQDYLRGWIDGVRQIREKF